MTALALSTVVVGYDGSPPAERALERAATLVATGGRVVVVTANPSVGPPGLDSEPILDGPPSDERSALLDRSRGLLHQRGAEAVLVATDADPAAALIQAARSEGAELILVGQTGVRLRDARATGLDRPERAPSRAVRRVGRAVGAAASRQSQNVEELLMARSGRGV